ncbi:50S ribosomal protein L32 [endosymbiont of Euscepes postfasciatus]|uniref:50S ribosomal protein L32 n=1 Tax=endosymbiont of Euscepes postfasciatus TaxID=650377 RepID=UPI000DC6F4E6|nr:50S ribosomal protein L32 [endosymbiont of Euscepes postfasciatus]BBA84636.1 50S ribosomal protein L32 [endosymbiont of Euscepes postfasciatus]
MAVQKRKKTKSKIGMRRSNKKYIFKNILKNIYTGEYHIYHRITKNGFYKNKLLNLKKK